MNLIKLFSTWYGLGDFKDLARRIVSDKLLIDKAFNFAKNSRYNGYQRRLASMIYKFFDKKSRGSGINIEVKPGKQVAEALQKPITDNF